MNADERGLHHRPVFGKVRYMSFDGRERL